MVIVTTDEKKEEQGNRDMTPEEIKNYQDLIEKIGLHKVKGYIFIGEVLEEDEVLGMKIDSVGFSTGIGTEILVRNIFAAMGGDIEVKKLN